LMWPIGLIILCSCLGFGFGFIKLKWIFSMYQKRTTENYQFDQFRTAGVTGNATINSQGQGDNPVCSARDEISQPSRPFSPRAATVTYHHPFTRAGSLYALNIIFSLLAQ